MKTRHTPTILLCLCLILALAVPACGETQEEDPVVVRVGNVSYPLSMVQSSLDSALDVASLLYGTPIEEDRQAGIDAAIEKFVNMGLIENKLAEAGKNGFTKEEDELLKGAAQSKYEELWQILYQRMKQSSEEVSEEDVTSIMESEGYTVEAIYDEYVVSERNHRAVELFCPEVTISREQVDAYYEERFVAPERERYQDHVALFEEEIVATNSESFYIPEGYRYIRQITLDYPKEATQGAKAQEKKLTNAMTAVATAFQKLATEATQVEDLNDLREARAAYDKANEAAAACREAWLTKLQEKAEPLLRETFDAIEERFNAGIDFKSLIEDYSTDKTAQNLTGNGYLFHPDSQTWPDAFKAAAMALENPGDISKPVYSETGIHILYYAGAAPAGDHVLTDEEREQLNATVLQYYQNEKLLELCDTWKPNYDIETHPELLAD
ncbi:MAG: peptidylprolyl isomerase [Clostridia bacterium]|nr:peptidylprolyl isomerase [Clostridia bacterium]MBQ6121994.1 peptidylprolyl isomerase [Clostridia bacterium]